MNQHTARLIARKLESNGAIAVLLRCCNDPTTDSWHTLYVLPETMDQEVADFLSGALDRTAKQHAAITKAHAILAAGV